MKNYNSIYFCYHSSKLKAYKWDKNSYMKIETKIERFTTPLYMESGRILEPYQIAYETYGELNRDASNVILICHALSGPPASGTSMRGD